MKVVRNGWIQHRQWKQSSENLVIHLMGYSGGLSRSVSESCEGMVTKDVPSSLPGKKRQDSSLCNHLTFCLFSFLLIESLLSAKHYVGIQYWMLTARITALTEQSTKGVRCYVSNHTNKCKTTTLIHAKCQNWYVCPGRSCLGNNTWAGIWIMMCQPDKGGRGRGWVS